MPSRMRFPFALSEISWNSLLEAPKTDHKKHRPGKTLFQTVLFLRDQAERRCLCGGGLLSGMDKKESQSRTLALRLLPFLWREPLTGKLPESLRGKMSIGGSAGPAERPARAIWKKAVSVRFPWAPHPQRSDRLNPRCRRTRLAGMSLQCLPA